MRETGRPSRFRRRSAVKAGRAHAASLRIMAPATHRCRTRGDRTLSIEPQSAEDQLFFQLRTRTAQRLRAAARGDHGLIALIGRERAACLALLRQDCPPPAAALQSAA